MGEVKNNKEGSIFQKITKKFKGQALYLFFELYTSS